MAGGFSSKGGTLGVFSLAMINVIAVDSLKTLPTAAKLEFSLIFYFAIAAIIFLIPIGLIAAELATAWPQKGGSYVWVKKAFGPRTGLLVVWIQWLYNVAWYPTILSLVAGTLAHVFFPGMENNQAYMVGSVLLMYWFSTLINLFGMRISSIISSVGALVGTLLPMSLIIILASIWIYEGNTATIELTIDALIPNFNNENSSTAYFVTIIFGLIGLEMSAIHANDVKDPKRDYPRALLLSTILILLSLSLSSLAIAVVVPTEELNIITGLIQAFSFFFNSLNIPQLTIFMAIAIAIGGIASVATWTIGPSKGLQVASEDTNTLSYLMKENKRGAPINVLIVQGVLCSALTLCYFLVPEIQATYWAMTALTAQLALVMHIVLFSAGIKLRYSHPKQERPFKIPGGNITMWLIAGLGISSCIIGIYLGFNPPSDINIKSICTYRVTLLTAIVLTCIPPFVLGMKNSAKS